MLIDQCNCEDQERIIVHVDPDIQEIIPQFLENTRDDVLVLRGALGRQSFETVRVLGHSMKGVGDFGFDSIREIGAALERSAKDEDIDTIRNLVDQLSTYLDLVHVGFE